MIYCSIDVETSGLNRETCQILEIGAVVEDCANPKPYDDLPKLKLVIERDSVVGQSYAINMNARIFRLLAQAQDIKDKVERDAFKAKHGIVSEERAVHALWEFLYVNGFGELYDVTFADDANVRHTGRTYAEALAISGGDLSRIELPRKNVRRQLKVNVAGKNFANFDKVFLEKLPGFTDLIRFRQRILDPCTVYTDFVADDEAPSMEKCFNRLHGGPHTVSHDAVEDALDVIRLLRPLYTTYDARMSVMRGKDVV